MARAKRTDRAEARRRHRASLASVEESTEPAEESGTAQVPQSKSGTTRPGFLGIFTSAIRPVDIRGDLAYLPTLVLRTKAVWLPGLFTAIAGLLALVPGVITSQVAPIIALFVIQTPLAGPFLAGIFAPRASWLAGMIIGLEASIFTLVIYLTAPLPPGAELTSSQLVSVVLEFFVVFPLFAMFVASFAAFYRRFLRNSNQAAAARRGQTRPKQRPAQRPSAARAFRRR